MRHVIFRLGTQRFALPLSAIREVVVPPSVFVRVPRAPRLVKGIINLRGRVVTVIELHALLEVASSTGAFERIVLLDRGRRDLGLLVNEVDGIEVVERIGRAPGRPSAMVRGMARLKGLAVTVLEPDGIDAAVSGAFGVPSSATA